jgi:hypothetical protein
MMTRFLSIVPLKIKRYIWRLIPRIHLVNTYKLSDLNKIDKIKAIPHKYSIEKMSINNLEQLKTIYPVHYVYERKIPPRILSPEWVGLAVIDKTNNNIAYLAWIIEKSIKYIEEFGIQLKNNEFLLKDGYCNPKYRHQGLHTRMEQERINYCINKGAKAIYIQIHNSNKKGIDSVLGNGYKLYKQNYVIQWPFFAIYREIFAFLRNPFAKIVK